MTVTRVEAYLAALAKTAGRAFDATGKPILTAVERRVLAEAEKADFAAGFQRAIGQEQARQRLAAIFRGEHRR